MNPLNEVVFWQGQVVKINHRGKRQHRILFVTGSALLNLDPYRRLRRRLALSDISYVTCSSVSTEFVVHFKSRRDYWVVADAVGPAVTALCMARETIGLPTSVRSVVDISLEAFVEGSKTGSGGKGLLAFFTRSLSASSAAPQREEDEEVTAQVGGGGAALPVRRILTSTDEALPASSGWRLPWSSDAAKRKPGRSGSVSARMSSAGEAAGGGGALGGSGGVGAGSPAAAGGLSAGSPPMAASAAGASLSSSGSRGAAGERGALAASAGTGLSGEEGKEPRRAPSRSGMNTAHGSSSSSGGSSLGGGIGSSNEAWIVSPGYHVFGVAQERQASSSSSPSAGTAPATPYPAATCFAGTCSAPATAWFTPGSHGCSDQECICLIGQ